MRESRLTIPLLSAALAGAILTFDWLLPRGVAGGAPYVLVVLLYAGRRWRRWIFPVAALVTALTLLGWLHSPTGSEPWIVLTNRLVSVFVVWIAAVGINRLGVLREERDVALAAREAALEKVEMLEGLLPICSFCKRIQEDENTWTEIEIYVGDHSGAEFSHGLCETCLREHYSEYASEAGLEP